MTTKRPDHLLLSLGPDSAKHRQSLTALAVDLDIIGQRGPSISHLAIRISEVYETDRKDLIAVLSKEKPMAKLNRDEIVERAGASNWKQVKREYKGKNRGEIVANMYYMWPDESAANEELATAIYNELN